MGKENYGGRNSINRTWLLSRLEDKLEIKNEHLDRYEQMIAEALWECRYYFENEQDDEIVSVIDQILELEGDDVE